MRLTVIRHEMIVGWFIVAALLIGAIGLVVNTRAKGLLNRATYQFVVGHGRGLKVGAPVEMKGIEVGNVAEMKMVSHHEVQVSISVARVYAEHVRSDAQAAIVQPPLLGTIKVELDPGESQTPAARGQTLATREEVALLDRLEGMEAKVNGVIATVDTFVRTAAGTLDEVRELVRRVDSGEGLAGQIVHDPALAKDVRGTVTSLKQASEEANALLQQLTDEQGEFRTLLRNVDGTLVDVREAIEQAEVSKTVASLRAASEALSKTATRMDVSEETRETLAAMKRASAAFRDLARELERQPNSVIFGRSPAASPDLRR